MNNKQSAALLALLRDRMELEYRPEPHGEIYNGRLELIGSVIKPRRIEPQRIKVTEAEFYSVECGDWCDLNGVKAIIYAGQAEGSDRWNHEFHIEVQYHPLIA